jgi:hypothetical protein
MFDASSPRGIRSYWKTAYLDELDQCSITTLVDGGRELRSLSPFSTLHVYHAGGAISRATGDTSAFGRRDAAYILNVIGAWADASQDDAHFDWVRRCWGALGARAGSGTYLNFLGDEGPIRVKAAYGAERYDRLASIKAGYDPLNVFNLNQNIEPARG